MAKKSEGKLFEEQFKKNAPDYAMVYRLPDQAQVYAYSDKIRFTQKNPCDYLMWDSRARQLYWLELKSTKSKSISFERTKDDKGMIHNHQIAGLERFSKWAGVICGFVIEYRSETDPLTIFIEINNFIQLLRRMPKKSFTVEDLKTYEIPYMVIPQTKKRVRYSYDIDGWLRMMRPDYKGEDDDGGIFDPCRIGASNIQGA